MKTIKPGETEVIETSRVFEFSDGAVRVSESEVHKFYCPERVAATRLVVGDAIERTKGFIAKTRAEFSELNSLMRELTVR